MKKLLTVILALSPTFAFAQVGQYTPFNPFLWDGTTVTLTQGTFLFPNGTVGSPSIAWSSDNDGAGTGFYRNSANQIGVAQDGILRWVFQATTFGPNASDGSDFGSAAVLFRTIYLSRAIQGSKTKALTESNATAFVQVAVPQTAAANYAGGEVTYTIYETDGTDSAVIEGNFKFSCVNKAGTESCAAIADVQTATIATSVNTLACTITAVTGLVDVVQFAANCTDAATLTQSTLQIQYRLNMPQPNTVTPQ